MGWGGINAMPQLLYPWERNLALSIQEARWVQGQSGRVQKISPPLGFDTQAVWLLASYCTYYASLAHTTSTTTTTTTTTTNNNNNNDCGGSTVFFDR